MKERPIIFNARSVRAILAGEKTQTRRVVKPQPAGDDFGKVFGYPAGSYTDNSGKVWRCPYGVPGDRLWVREAWADLRGMGFGYNVEYKANGLTADGNEDSDAKRIREDYGVRYRSPIFMPRWASRLTLRVTAVKLERLQDITEADAIAEGVQAPVTGSSEWGEPAEVVYEFMRLWDAMHAMHAKRGHSWDSNPYVWVVTFERVDTD